MRPSPKRFLRRAPVPTELCVEQHATVTDTVAIASTAIATNEPAPAEDETPPKCPSCHRRLVMLAMQWGKDERGATVRRQLWGCPRGHATAHRTRGRFAPIQLLESFND
jgi:hypothetical protein